MEMLSLEVQRRIRLTRVLLLQIRVMAGVWPFPTGQISLSPKRGFGGVVFMPQVSYKYKIIVV